jgi:hypothetical protein
MTAKLTLRDLLEAVNDAAATDDEAVATIVHLVNSGLVRLGGRLTGATIDLHDRTSRDIAA